MFKNLLAIILLSVAVIFTMTYAQTALHALLSAYDWISNELKDVFTQGKAGDLARQLLALLFVPFIVGFVPALIFWFARRKWFPYFMHLVWATWLIQTSAIVILYKTTGA